jgi:glycosyltransferase involved in cell wall biosynthesis
LHVVHVVLSLDVGGSERNVINQVREGHALGQRVSVVCLERPGVLAPRVEALGGTLVCLNKRPGVQLGLFGQLRAVLNDLRADVVHSHQVGTLFYAGLATAGLQRARMVHTAHGREHYADRARTRLLGRLGGARVDRFFCLTTDMVSEVRSARIVPRCKIRLITNGIDTSLYRTRRGGEEIRQEMRIPDSARVIGTVGRLVPIKNHHLLIRAFAQIKRMEPDAHLLLVGGGPLHAELGALAADLGLADSVHFAGYQQDVIRHLSAMDYFVLTSRSEGTPQAVLEALVAGLPVAASNVGGLPEVIEHGRTGLLFPSDDAAACAATIERLMCDDQLVRTLTEAARQATAARYDVSRMAREYHQHYLELHSPRASAA